MTAYEIAERIEELNGYDLYDAADNDTTTEDIAHMIETEPETVTGFLSYLINEIDAGEETGDNADDIMEIIVDINNMDL